MHCTKVFCLPKWSISWANILESERYAVLSSHWREGLGLAAAKSDGGLVPPTLQSPLHRAFTVGPEKIHCMFSP